MNVIIKFDYFDFSLNCYSLVTREEDQLLFDGDDNTFKAESHEDPYVLMPEDAVNKGIYAATIEDANWQDGVYQVSVFKQAGGTPVPANDTKIGTGNIYIRNGMQVFANDNLLF